MKDKIIVKVTLISLVIISILNLSLNIMKIYINKINPIKEKLEIYNNLKMENNNIKLSIKRENKKYEANKKLMELNREKREKLEKIIYEKEEKLNGKIVYLTFDDGPSIYTNEILDILDKYNVKATFFVVCSNLLPEYSKKYIEKGHTIGLHSCSHSYKNIYKSEENYFNDLISLSNMIENSIGYKSKYVRFPGGSSNTVSMFNRGIMVKLTNSLKDNGYKYYDWNIDSNDAGGANSEQIYSNVIGALQDNDRNVSMVLMHDTKLTTKDALEKIIKDAIDMGYTFGNINDYTPEVHHYINN